MRHLHPCTFLFFLLPFFANAQDTIRVQTFTWDSDNRSDLFQFPDDPAQTYRKIWMRYNMRCHDNLVGNGAVGCREWDYSCNTFLYDPSRVDSTRQVAPTHVISNFSGNTFDYTTQPVFEYTQYLQHEVTLTLDNEVAATVGTGTDEMILAGDQPVGRAQFLYLASELTSAGLTAGPIHALDLESSQAGQIDFLRIRMKHTGQAGLDAQSPDLEGFTEAFFQNTGLQGNGPQRLNFYQPFDWDGLSNLLVEFSFTSQPTGATPAVLANGTGFTSAIFSGQADYSLHFAGAGQVTVPPAKFATISNQITVSLWCYGSPGIMPANSTIFEGKDASNRRQANVHLPWGNGQVYWDCGNDGNYDRINKQATDADYEGQWNHWAFTKNASTGEMKIYLNGQLWHSGTGLTKPIDVQEFAIGAAVTGASKYFGNVDEFQVWDVALDEATIAAWMRRHVDASHPNYANLVAYFPMDEGTGFDVNDAAGGQAASVDLPAWQGVRGENLYKNFFSGNLRPNATFVQGDATVQDVTVAVLDSVLVPLHSVTSYGLDGTDLVVTDQQYFYQAGQAYVYDESGQLLDSVAVAPEGSIEIGELVHYPKAEAKFELLSLVTPYGNGLGLGAAGKTFWFDVTDYAPVLQGEKRISIEMGGQWQEELDIEFLFITGTPPRDVLNMQHIWPFRRGGYAEIQTDRYFEPRTVALSADASQFKLRSAVTGHGQNGEFVPRTHYLNVDGGTQDFTYQVWKECADNPIYPQGGTWIFDRAGWCPGAATDVHEFDITDLVTPGGTVELDYGVNGANLTEANYLVANQLVTYGDWNFALDASLERIARPNSADVEFERINPACTRPLVWVQNTGATEITSLAIEYLVLGNANALTHEWTGSIAPGASEAIELPVSDLGFWSTPASENVFRASIAQVNGQVDGQPANDTATSPFELAKVFETGSEYFLKTSTNNNGNQYSYTIRNAAGDVVMERSNMTSNTTYDDALELAPGCYTLDFDDSGDDGLEFWFYPGNGTGALRFTRLINGFTLTEKTFDPDFGTGVKYDFVIEGPNAAVEPVKFRAFSTWPNPAADQLNVELRGFEGEAVMLQLTDLQGRILRSTEAQPDSQWQTQLDLSDLPTGMYLLRAVSAGKVWVREVVKG